MPPPNPPGRQPVPPRGRVAVDFELKDFDRATRDLDDFAKKVARIKRDLADRGFRFVSPLANAVGGQKPGPANRSYTSPTPTGTSLDPNTLAAVVRSTVARKPEPNLLAALASRSMPTGFVAGGKGVGQGWGAGGKGLPVTITAVSNAAGRSLAGGAPVAARGRGGLDLTAPIRAIVTASTVASGSILGLAKAGFRNTVEGNRLASQFTMLSREIAGIFLPVVDVLTRKLMQVNLWLSQLTIQQQAKLMKTGLAVGGVAAAGVVGRPVIGAVGGVAGGAIQAVTALVPTLARLAAAGGPVTLVLGAVGVAIAAAGAGFAVLVAASKPIRDALWRVIQAMEKVWEATAPVRQALLELAEDVVVPVLTAIAEALEELVQNETVVGFIQELADKLSRMGVVVRGVAWSIAEMLDALVNFRLPDFDQIVRDIANAAKEQEEDKANRKKKKKDDGAGGHGLPTPVNPGRESIVEGYNRLQDAVTREGGLTKDQRDEQFQQAVLQLAKQLVAGQQQGNGQNQFQNRPAPNGRPN